MDVTVKNYYDTTKFSPTNQLIFMEIEKFFTDNLFRGDSSRVFYASESYAFRQRLNYLSKAGKASISELQLPFMSYFRQGNWQMDSLTGIQNATVALDGYTDMSIGGVKVRFLQCKMNLACTAFFNSDKDAQMAYEAILWMDKPMPQQFIVQGLEYKGSLIPFPMRMAIKDLQFNPIYTESQWLTSVRIFPIKFNLEISSVVMSQEPQTPESSIFWTDDPPVITKHVVLDFLSYKYNNMFWDTTHPVYEIDGTFYPEPEVNGSINITNIGNTGFVVNWDYDSLADPLLEDNVIITLNGVINVEVAKEIKTYTFAGMEPETIYIVDVAFIKKNGQITRVSQTIGTTTDNPITLKGMRGLR